MKNDSDIGENTAIVLVTGIVVGAPLLFVGWLLKRAIDLGTQPVPPAVPTAALELTTVSHKQFTLALPFKQ